MVITLKAGGMLKDYLKPDLDEFSRRVDVEPGTPLREILLAIGVPPGHIAMAFCGERLVNLMYVPSDGDVITLRPPVQGG